MKLLDPCIRQGNVYGVMSSSVPGGGSTRPILIEMKSGWITGLEPVMTGRALNQTSLYNLITHQPIMERYDSTNNPSGWFTLQWRSLFESFFSCRHISLSVHWLYRMGLLAEYRSSAKIAVGKRILFFPNISRENKQKVTQSISTRELNVFPWSSTAVQSRNSSFSNSVSCRFWEYITWLSKCHRLLTLWGRGRS